MIENWVYIVYDIFTAKSAYFSSRDQADEFVEQESSDSPKDRYSIHSYRVDSGRWD